MPTTKILTEHTDRLTAARNAVLLAHARLLGVLEDEHALDAESTRINAALATGGALCIESLISATRQGVVAITLLDADGARVEIASLPDMQRSDMQ